MTSGSRNESALGEGLEHGGGMCPHGASRSGFPLAGESDTRGTPPLRKEAAGGAGASGASATTASLPQTRARLREPDAPAGEPGGLIYLSGSSQRNNHCVPPFPSGLQRGEKRKDAHAHHPVGGFLAPRALRSGKAGHLPRDPQVCLLPWLHIKAPGKPGKASPAAPSTIPRCEADPHLQDHPSRREQRRPWSRPSPPTPTPRPLRRGLAPSPRASLLLWSAS